MDSKVNRGFGKRIRDLRIESGLTTRELAARSGLSHPMVVKTERGERNPGITTAIKLTIGLGLSHAQRVELIKNHFNRKGLNKVEVLLLDVILEGGHTLPRHGIIEERKNKGIEGKGRVSQREVVIKFINQSRRITGRELKEPDEIKEYFEEILRNRELLEQGFESDERTFIESIIELEKSSPQEAELLKKEIFEEIQKLRKRSEKLSRRCGEIQAIKGPTSVEDGVMLVSDKLSQSKIMSEDIDNTLKDSIPKEEIASLN
jgi:transcriptional regulator with XRE-family HTH domain